MVSLLTYYVGMGVFMVGGGLIGYGLARWLDESGRARWERRKYRRQEAAARREYWGGES